MPNDHLINFNPGEQLQFFLKEIYPPNPGDKNSFVSRIDNALVAEGEFAALVYNSSINYMVRRFITTAEYFKRKYGGDGPSERFIIQLRRFLEDEINIPSNRIEKLLGLLLECLRVRVQEPTRETKKRIRRNAKNRSGSSCYICGCELNFDIDGQYNSAEVEHKWPNSMGGVNHDSNLEVSCFQCNKMKLNYIDASDFHYEEICIVSDKEDETFPTDLHRGYRVALWAKSNFSCVVCGEPAMYVGELKLGRRNRADSWHFLNIDAYCERHSRE